MKSMLGKMIGAALLAACLGPSAARAEGRKLRAQIPFPFQAGAHALPAGQYEFEQDERRALLFITGPGGRRAALTTLPAGPPRSGEESHLVFECPEAGCRLAEVSAAGALQRAGLPAGKNPAPVAKGGRTDQVIVSLAAR
jgi:hypothetical protein